MSAGNYAKIFKLKTAQTYNESAIIYSFEQKNVNYCNYSRTEIEMVLL